MVDLASTINTHIFAGGIKALKWSKHIALVTSVVVVPELLDVITNQIFLPDWIVIDSEPSLGVFQSVATILNFFNALLNEHTLVVVPITSVVHVRNCTIITPLWIVKVG